MSLLSRISRVKPESMIAEEVETESCEGTGLKKIMSLTSLTLFGVANVIGAGIFITIGRAAATEAGPAVILSFIFSGFTCALTGVCYSRFSSRLSSSGSAYTYVYSSMGEVFAFLAGLGLCSETSVAAAALCRGLSGRIRVILSEEAPANSWLPNLALTNPDTFFEVDLLAPCIGALITIACLLGAKDSARLGSFMTIFNVCMISVFIIAGFSSSSFSGEAFSSMDNFMSKSFTGVMRATTTTLFTYIGWDSVCCLSEEVKDPKKTIPRAITGTLMLVGTLYCLLAIVVCGLMPDMSELAKNMDLESIFKTSGMIVISQVVRYGIMFTALTAALASSQGQPRLWFRMAKDGLVPYWLCKLDDSGTPTYAILVTGAITCLVSCLVNVDVIFDTIIVGVLMMQAFVCIGCLMHEARDLPISSNHRTCIVSMSLFAVIGGALLQQIKESSACESSVYWMGVFVATISTSFISGVLAMVQYEKSQRLSTLIPLVATLANFFFMGNLGFSKIGQLLLAYAVVLFAVYFLYGLKHSKLQRHVDKCGS